LFGLSSERSRAIIPAASAEDPRQLVQIPTVDSIGTQYVFLSTMFDIIGQHISLLSDESMRRPLRFDCRPKSGPEAERSRSAGLASVLFLERHADGLH
jgi:hypothetical protein